MENSFLNNSWHEKWIDSHEVQCRILETFDKIVLSKLWTDSFFVYIPFEPYIMHIFCIVDVYKYCQLKNPFSLTTSHFSIVIFSYKIQHNAQNIDIITLYNDKDEQKRKGKMLSQKLHAMYDSTQSIIIILYFLWLSVLLKPFIAYIFKIHYKKAILLMINFPLCTEMLMWFEKFHLKSWKYKQ